jgi:hypothetical protein
MVSVPSTRPVIKKLNAPAEDTISSWFGGDDIDWLSNGLLSKGGVVDIVKVVGNIVDRFSIASISSFKLSIRKVPI